MHDGAGVKFVSAELDMLETEPGGRPVRFRYEGAEHRVEEIVREWQDYGFSAAAFRRDWRTRRHRNYYEIRTDRGLHGQVYFDRGVKPSSPRAWVLLEVYE
ncbi:MAG: hypothetical protein C4524_03945 [Candidatus Zixiibacteriota bacterium]|nr:MAG: hypothetical protein C4524_03945 [candidate division Zixibacteria bacterium]